MRFNIHIKGEASDNELDRKALIKALQDKELTVHQNGNEVGIEFEDHDLVVEIVRRLCGIQIKKVATQ